MRKISMAGAAVAVIAAAGMSASAETRARVAVGPEALEQRFSPRGIVDGIGFEASEGYLQGDIAGQNGWLTNNSVATPIGAMEVRDGLGAGNGSPNALRMSKGPQAQGTFGIAQAPADLGATSLSVDTRIDDNGGANYFVRGLGLLGGGGAFVSWRVEFDYRGHIFLQNPVTSAFADTGVSWVHNQYNTLTVTLSGAGISYMYGATSLGTTPVSASGAYFDLTQFGHDNYEDFGTGSFSGGGNPAAGYFDNLNAVPAPGAAGVLAMGGLLAARRRRR